jgi:hypothetical protein
MSVRAQERVHKQGGVSLLVPIAYKHRSISESSFVPASLCFLHSFFHSYAPLLGRVLLTVAGSVYTCGAGSCVGIPVVVGDNVVSTVTSAEVGVPHDVDIPTGLKVALNAMFSLQVCVVTVMSTTKLPWVPSVFLECTLCVYVYITVLGVLVRETAAVVVQHSIHQLWVESLIGSVSNRRSVRVGTGAHAR